MATNYSGNRNIEARLVMDSTGNWKLIANATPPGVDPPIRRQLLKVTGPDGKIKFFYGNKPEEGGLNPILKQASPTPEMKSKPDENKRLLTESQAKSLAVLLSSVKSQMTRSSSSETSLAGSVQASVQTVVPAGSEQTPARGSNASVVAQGPSYLGRGQSNQLVFLVAPGSESPQAKCLQAPVPPGIVARRTMHPGSNLVCGNSGKPQPLKPSTMYVIQQSTVTPPPPNMWTNKKYVANIHKSNHGRIEGPDPKYRMLSHLLKTHDGMHVSEDISSISSGIANVKQVEIPTYNQRTGRHVDPILSRFDTTSCVPYAAASTSVLIPVSKSVDVSAVKLGMPVPPPLSISRGNATTPSSNQLVLMPAYYMPAVVTPGTKASCTPFEQCSASPGSTQSNVPSTVPVEPKPKVPMTNTTDPSSNTSSSRAKECRKVGSHLASNTSVKELLNELALERENKACNEIPDASVKGNDNCTGDTRSNLRIDSVFSLHHNEEVDHLEVDQKLKVKTEVECVHNEAKDSGSGISSGTEKCGSAKEDSSTGEDKIIQNETIRRKVTKPLMVGNKCRHSFPKKAVMNYHMLEPFVVLERVDFHHIERVDFHHQTTSRNGERGESKTSKLQNAHDCSRVCREKLLMKLCREKRIPCINRLKSEVITTAKQCRRIRRKVKKTASLEEVEEVRNETSNPFDIFLKNLVEKERRRHEKDRNKKTSSTSADELTCSRRYFPYNTLGKHVRVGRYRVLVPRNSGVVETFQMKSVVPQDTDILPDVPAPAAFEDIEYAEDVQPMSAQPVELGGDVTELGSTESAFGLPKSPSSETDVVSEICTDNNFSAALDCKKERDSWNPILDKHGESDEEEVQSESGSESPDDVLASDEEQKCVQMDPHPEREEGPDAEDVTAVDTSTLTNDSICTEETLDLHQSDVTTSINEDSDAVMSDDEVADLKAVETPPNEADSDDDWGTTGLEVDTDSEHDEDMDIMCPGLPPDVTESLPEPDEEVANSRLDNPSANIGGNERIQRLKAQLEEQTRQVDSLRRLRRCTR